MQENLLENNQITIVGKVVGECEFSHELFGEKFYEFKVEVKRLSDSADVLPIIISERLAGKDELLIDTQVAISGQFRSYNNKKTESNKLKLVIFARDLKFGEEAADAKNPNQVFLNGFICKNPIYRKTPLGREICDIILAVNRTYHKSDYIPIITWGRNARFSETLNIGDNVKIWGRIQSREYDKKLEDGTSVRKVAYEVSVSKMEISEENNNRKEEENTVTE